MRQLTCLIALALTLLITSATTAQAPEPLTLGYQGHLTDLTRQPINGERDITFRFYNARVGGEVVWEETVRSVLVEDGDFSVNLGLNTPLPINESPDTPLFPQDARTMVEIAKVQAERAKLRKQAIPKEVAAKIEQANRQLEQLQSPPSTTDTGSSELTKAREELARLKREGVDYSKLSEPQIGSTNNG